MTRELLYIGHEDGFGTAPAGATHAFAASDAGAGNRPLERPKHQLIVFNQIKAYPEKPDCLAQGRCRVGQIGNQIRLASSQGFYLGQ
jgi:hypothetical protein